MPDQNFEHPAKVSRFRDGRFEVHPLAARADYTVWAGDYVESSQGVTDIVYEGMLAVALSETTAQLVAIPLVVPVLSLDDIVRIDREEVNDALIVVGISEKSDNATFRIICEEGESIWMELQYRMEDVDGWFDIYNESSVSASVPMSQVSLFLARLEELKTGKPLRYERTDRPK